MSDHYEGNYTERVNRAVYDLRQKRSAQLERAKARCNHMKQTFYVATAWQNKEQALKVANYLESRGMRWAFDHNWAKGEPTDVNSIRASVVAQKDLQAAIEADLFILLLFDPLTPGCHGELGARVSHNREAHVVRQGVAPIHLFHRHPCVVEHENIEDLVNHVFRS